jgi:hypothetical protein
MSPHLARRAGWAAALALVLSSPIGFAGTGYERDYDYPGQGDDWYARTLPDMSRDYAPTLSDLLISGDDYCLGYEAFFDYIGRGPILERTNETDREYEFRFEYVVSDAPCFRSDGPPECDDGDPCTVDSWDGSQCTYVAPPIPAEVQGLELQHGTTPAFAVLSWLGDPDADVYDVYRAGAIDLGDLSCMLDSVPGTSTADDGVVPSAGQCFYMLATGRNCSGESPLGGGRVNSSPCIP